MSHLRPSDHLTVSYPPGVSQPTSGGNSPIDRSPANGGHYPFPPPPGLTQQSRMTGASRSGAASPSHDMGATGNSARFLSKRAREIQLSEGFGSNNQWSAPPTSGHSTPLAQNIPESPTDGFPGFTTQVPGSGQLTGGRRARAGTLPSRFSGETGTGPLGLGSLPGRKDIGSATSLQSGILSPPAGLTMGDQRRHLYDQSGIFAQQSRLRSDSMPQKSPFASGHISGTSSPFGPSIFSTGAWNPTTRDRASTLASIASVGSNGLSSPAQSRYSTEGSGDNDGHVSGRTLEFLGLDQTPQPARAQLATATYAPTYPEFPRVSNRNRSYSVNNADRYQDEDADDAAAEALERKLIEVQAAVQRHNATVQTLATQFAMSSNRPRASTVGGVLDTPNSRMHLHGYYPTPSRLDNSLSADQVNLSEEKEYDMQGTVEAVAAMNLGRSNSRNNGNGMLRAEEGLDAPTTSLWLGNIPASTTESTLREMFRQYGQIVSCRVLTHKNCGFVNFGRVEEAVQARNAVASNNYELFPGAPQVRIGFAKPPSQSTTPGPDGVFPSPSPVPFANSRDGNASANESGVSPSGDATASLAANVEPTVRPLKEMTEQMLQIAKEFGATEEGVQNIAVAVHRAIDYTDFIDEIPPIQDPSHTRVHDAPKLRDIRKRMEARSFSQTEVEQIAVDMLPEIAELASDYLGNTVVQKLFEACSDPIRDLMLEQIAPHMAEIGCHKNGTWAAQKIITECNTPQQKSMLAKHLHPYTVPLFLDQYGNYVLQCMLKYGAPYTDFIFDTMLSRMWEIAQGRFGARAMRACLESHHASKDQQRMLAAAIALHSVQLATNANGALLLTWFLDTCTFPQRRTVLSPQLVPYLVHLCTHKVAFLTVLKVINQKPEGEARDTILKALFFSKNDQVLEAILRDHGSGAAMIFKVLTTPLYDETVRSQIVEKVKTVLVRVKADRQTGGYKRLMDEVGLSTRGGGGGAREHGNNPNDRTRPSSRQAHQHGHHQGQPQQHQDSPTYTPQARHAMMAGQYGAQNGQFYPSQSPGGASAYDYGHGIQRSDSVEPPVMPAHFPAYGVPGPMYGAGSPALAPATLQQMQQMQQMQQAQYQPGMMARGVPPMNQYYPSNGYPSPSPSVDQFRGQNHGNGSPVQPPQAYQQPSSFMSAPYGMPPAFAYGAGGMNGMQAGSFMSDQGSNNGNGNGHNGNNRRRR